MHDASTVAEEHLDFWKGKGSIFSLVYKIFLYLNVLLIMKTKVQLLMYAGRVDDLELD